MKEPKHLDQAFEKVCQEMLEMFIKKHKDYGKGNILDTKELGIAFRVSDKLNRLKHLLIEKKKPVNESIEETWVDIAVYAVIAVLFRRSWFKKLELKTKKTGRKPASSFKNLLFGKRERMKKKFWLHLFLLTIAYLLLRLCNLSSNVNYSDEQGKFLLKIFEIWQAKKLTLIGPPTSFTFRGRYFFQGPAMYYLLLPAMILGQWNVLAGSYFLIFLNLAALWLIYLSGRKLYGDSAGLLASFIFAIFPETVYYTKFVWNPNFLPVIGSIVLALLVRLFNLKPPLRIFLIGFFLGLGLQFHFQTTLLVVLISTYLLLKNGENKSKILFLTFFGLMTGYSPLVLFELRNNFYNLKTIWFVFKNGGFWQNGKIHSYYFLSFFPFFFVFGAGVFIRLAKKYKLLAVLIFSGLTFYSSFKTGKQIFENRGMPKDWRYPYVIKAVRIIKDEGLKNYNIANLLTGDTRAYAFRYLLAAAEHKPLGIKEYPQAEYLFVISSASSEKVEKSLVWEIASFGGKIKKTWSLGQGEFFLYLLSKQDFLTML